MSEQKQMLIGQVDQNKIDEWKKKYPAGIYMVTSDEHAGYFKNPSRKEVNCALSKADANQPLAVIEEFAGLTFIGGSEEIIKRDDLFLGVCSEIRQKMNGVPAKLVNL